MAGLLVFAFSSLVIGGVKEDLAVFEIERQRLKQEITQLRQQLETFKKENKKLEQQNEDLKKQPEKLLVYIESLKEQIESLKEQIFQLEEAKGIVLPSLAVPKGRLETASKNKKLAIKKEIVKIFMEYRERNYDSKWIKEQLESFQKKYEGLDFSFEYEHKTYTPVYIQTMIANYSEKQEAVRQWMKLISEYPDSKYILFAYDQLGDLHKDKGKYKEAIHYYLECIENRDKFPEVSRYIFVGSWGFAVKEEGRQEKYIAECYEKLKDYQSAIVYWQKYKDMQEEESDEAIKAEVKIERLYELLE